MKTAEQRFNNIIGQLEGAKKILANDQRHCLEVLNQLKAVRSATSALMDKILENEFNRCLPSSSSKKRESIKKIFKEITRK